MNSQRSVNLLKSIFRHLYLLVFESAFLTLSLGFIEGFVFGLSIGIKALTCGLQRNGNLQSFVFRNIFCY